MARKPNPLARILQNPRGWIPIAAVFHLACFCGCATSARKIAPADAIAQAPAPQTLAVFDGPSRAQISWDDALRRLEQADAVFVGETHDDASAHRVEHALVDAFLAAHPKAALSLEMLERDEQSAVDSYLAHTTSVDEFMTATNSRNWAGDGTWLPWYQPMIDCARHRGARVVAANAPRKYVSQARLDGYESLAALAAEERALFEIDPDLARDGDWERLRDLMRTMYKERAIEEATEPSEPTDDDVDRIHRSQRVWDRTMGTSAARAFNDGWAIIHIAGGFHLQERLGTVAQFARLCPTAKILVISLQPDDAAQLSEEDVHGADIVIHTHRKASALAHE